MFLFALVEAGNSVGGTERRFKCARALLRPLWSNKRSVCLWPLHSLFRSQRGVDVSVRGSLEVVETKADGGAWFFSVLWRPIWVDSWAGRPEIKSFSV